MRNLTLEGKLIIFKALVVSKILCLTLTTIAEEIKKIQKAFIWNSSNIRLKNGTLCNNFEKSDLIKHQQKQ